VLRTRNGTSKSPFRLALGDRFFGRGRPAVAAALHCAERHSAHNDWTAYRMRLHMASAGYGNLRPLRHSSHTPAPYASRGLPSSGFALPWRAAGALTGLSPLEFARYVCRAEAAFEA